jgi:hypothetical protein
VREPDDPTDPTPHLMAQTYEGVRGWRLAAASRRGKLHAHEARYRDDAFALGTASRWNLLAVADGAGSCRLSRVGARVSTDTAIAGLTSAIMALEDAHSPDALRQIATRGMLAAQGAVLAEAQRRQIPARDLSATLLLIAHLPPSQEDPNHYIAAGQIGDGMILAMEGAEQFLILGEANVGNFSGETTFLTSVSAGELAKNARGYALPRVDLVMAMTDGIADDFFPPARFAPELARGITAALRKGNDPSQALLQLIAYEKRDSADDRTLAVLYPSEGH